MNDLTLAFATALHLILSFDPDLVEIVLLSLQVSGTAVVLAALVGLPFGAAVGALRFPGRRALVVLLNASMGLPPVVVGLLVYLVLSRSGPLGWLGLLFTPSAMVIAQTLLIAPIIAALTRQAIEDLSEEYDEPLRSMGANFPQRVATLLFEGRLSLATTLLAGFGRAIAEVGAVIIVGGNIAHVTRVMTTAIALETSRGDLPLALGLGLVLVGIAIVVNGCAQWIQEVARRAAT
ncbi:MAG: ABC transporter permease subunit [bacterium]|nr:ABC transporter permease subunit [bacterium]MCP5067287.1 ABC transporter permease subunit [bacterium]